MKHTNNIFVEDIRAKGNDIIDIINKIKRRPSYVQNYCILYAINAEPNMKLYQIARIVELDYYQSMKRVEELSKNGFITVNDGRISITDKGIELMNVLNRLIVLMHAANEQRID
ncbi:MAG: winged helix-turn-helix domain-containing protein [Candidatus Nitrosocaldaceae archaeon]